MHVRKRYYFIRIRFCHIWGVFFSLLNWCAAWSMLYEFRFIGHGLSKDFSIINLFVPKSQIIDTVQLYRLPGRRLLSLRFLAHHVLRISVQDSELGHDSVEDAIVALQLYKCVIEYLSVLISYQLSWHLWVMTIVCFNTKRPNLCSFLVSGVFALAFFLGGIRN